MMLKIILNLIWFYKLLRHDKPIFMAMCSVYGSDILYNNIFRWVLWGIYTDENIVFIKGKKNWWKNILPQK